MSTTTKVWFQLFLGDTALDPVTVTLNRNDDIDDLKGAVKIECGENLQGVSSAQLRVYPPGTQVPIPEGADDTALDPRRRVDDLNGDSVTFVIVAPAIGTFSDLMEYLPLYCILFHCRNKYCSHNTHVSFCIIHPTHILATVVKSKERRNARN